MSDALSPPSPLPMDEEVELLAPAEELSPEPSGSRPPSPDTSMEVTEDVSFEISDGEPLPPPPVDSDLLVDVPTQPLSPSPSEAALPETRAETPQAEVRSDVFEGTETVDSVAPSEAGPAPLAAPSDDDSRSERSTSPMPTESIALQDDMDVDVVGEPLAEADEPVLLTTERRSQSASPSPLSPETSQTEVQPPPPATLAPAPVFALPPSAFMLPPKPSNEVFIPAKLAPVGESPRYSLDLATVEPRSLITSEWLNPEFSLNRNYTLPSAKSLPPDQQKSLKLGKSLRKKEKEKEKDKGLESRKDGADDWTPLGINKWGVTIKANPLWKRVSRATKTMTTRDWNVSVSSIQVAQVLDDLQVAFTELRLLRVLERIEQLKEAGKWSYRQPKKQRGVGNVSKTHWDYLLDEMVRCSLVIPKSCF
jgi:chromatin modification-related protein VID21